MILSSPLKDNNSTEISLTGPWTFTSKGAKVTGALATFAVTPAAGGTGQFWTKSFTIGLKGSSLPFYLRNGSGQTIIVMCTAAGILTVSKQSTNRVVDLKEYGVDIASEFKLELHFEYVTGSGYIVNVYFNGYNILAYPIINSSVDNAPINAHFIFEGNSVVNPIYGQLTVSDLYVKEGGPLRNWKVSELKAAVQDVQGNVNLPQVFGKGQPVSGEVRTSLSFVGQEPIEGTLAQLTVRTNVARTSTHVFEEMPVVTFGLPGLLMVPTVNSDLKDLTQSSVSVLTDVDASFLDTPLTLSVASGSSKPKVLTPANKLYPFAQFRFIEDAMDEVTKSYGVLNNSTALGALTTDAAITSNMTFPSFVPSRDFTIEAKFDHTQRSNGNILRCGNSWSVVYDTTIKFRVDLGHSVFELDSGVAPEVGVETHVAVVGALGTVTLYVDGIPTASNVLYGKLPSTSGLTYVAEGYAGTTRDVRLCYSAQYQGEFEVADLPEFTRPFYTRSEAYAIVAQEEFLPGVELGVLEYVPPEPEPEPELPPEPEPPFVDAYADFPLAQYTFAGNSLVDDTSGVTIAKTIHHNLIDGRLHVTTSGTLSSTTRKVSLPDADFTIELKINLTTTTPPSAGYYLHQYQASTEENKCWGIGVDTDFKPYFDFDNEVEDKQRLTASDAIVPTEDSHIAVVRSGDKFHLYVNGKKQPAYQPARRIASGVGTLPYLTMQNNSAAAGIWDIRINDKAMYVEDFTVVPLPVIPIGIYTQEEESKIALQIQFRDGNQTQEDSKSRAVAGNWAKDGRYMLHGTNTYYEVRDTPYFGEADFTIECTFSAVGPAPGQKSLVGDWNTTNSQRFNLSINPDRTLECVFSLDGKNTNVVTLTSSGTFDYAKDNHVVVERVGSTVSLYLNRVLQGTLEHPLPLYNIGTVGTVGSRFNLAVASAANQHTIWNVRCADDSLYKGKLQTPRIFKAFRSSYALTSSYAQALVVDETPQPKTEHALTSSYAQALVVDETPLPKTEYAITATFAQVFIKL